ncbi:MAG: hypothetical protein K8R09_03805, partial [Desulfobacterales bacterium]|nr:hypothetical protein [Desulfobacterales bacterium]
IALALLQHNVNFDSECYILPGPALHQLISRVLKNSISGHSSINEARDPQPVPAFHNKLFH